MEFDEIGGRYSVIERIGKGAMGVVYKAYDPVLDRVVAIKKMVDEISEDAELRQRFYVEARAAARLNHRNIVTIHELEESDGEIYIVMEMLEGVDLSSVIRRRVTIPLEAKLSIVGQLCEGLDYAHRGGIVHRDIKPGNIHLSPTGLVKILDFGIARLASSNMTGTGALLGTPDYMSPEQVMGEAIDSRSDLFAVGGVLYELLASAKAFESDTIASLLIKIARSPHVPITDRVPDIPVALVSIVNRLLAKERDLRPATAGDVAAELRAVALSLTTGSDAAAAMILGGIVTEQTMAIGANAVPGADTPRPPTPRAKTPRPAMSGSVSRGDARTAARESAQTSSNTRLASLALQRGRELRKAGDLAGAIQVFRSVLEVAPGNAEALEELQALEADMRQATAKPTGLSPAEAEATMLSPRALAASAAAAAGATPPPTVAPPAPSPVTVPAPATASAPATAPGPAPARVKSSGAGLVIAATLFLVAAAGAGAYYLLVLRPKSVDVSTSVSSPSPSASPGSFSASANPQGAPPATATPPPAETSSIPAVPAAEPALSAPAPEPLPATPPAVESAPAPALPSPPAPVPVIDPERVKAQAARDRLVELKLARAASDAPPLPVRMRNEATRFERQATLAFRDEEYARATTLFQEAGRLVAMRPGRRGGPDPDPSAPAATPNTSGPVRSTPAPTAPALAPTAPAPPPPPPVAATPAPKPAPVPPPPTERADDPPPVRVPATPREGVGDIATFTRAQPTSVDQMFRATPSARAAVARITALIEKYTTAMEQKDAATLREVRDDITPLEQRILRQGKQVSYKLDDLKVGIDGQEGTATARRTVTGELESGEKLNLSGQVTLRLIRRPAGWVITDIR